MPVNAPTLESLLAGRDNNLNLIRMCAATLVLVSHAFIITGGTLEPLQAETGQTLGRWCVVVFFGLSGLLIARSFDRRPSMTQFALARVMRLYPALVVVLALSVLAGGWLTRLPLADYFAQGDTWSYVPINLTLGKIQQELPGVFETNPHNAAVNGSLWTLFYEVGCYAGVVVLGLVGALRSRLLSLAAMVAVVLFHFAGPWLQSLAGPQPRGILAVAINFAALTYPFMIGSLAYVWRERLPLSGYVALLLWVPTAFMSPGLVMESWITLALVYSALWFGFVPKGRLLAYNRLGDYSYGIYIYAFPVQQTLVHLMPGMTPLANIALAFPIALVLAVLSWKLVEERALAAVRPMAEMLTRSAARQPA